MRKVRITWLGAFHHAMDRGINGENIFETPDLKEIFLDLVEENSKK